MTTKPHNNGTWTDARKKGFIVSALRSAFTRWGPKQSCIKQAWIRRGVYKCEGCKEEVPATLPPKTGGSKRIKNIMADHIHPIVCPATGFVDYNTWIERGFVEADGFQALCKACHDEKTTEEREIATLRKRKEKLNGSN